MTQYDQQTKIKIHSFIRKSFVRTADENYILLRYAYFNELFTDFWWLSLHAIEKYIKAILLFNNIDTRKYNHRITDLYKAIPKEIQELLPTTLERPENLDIDFWQDTTFEEKIEYISLMGDPSNRYMNYGYSVYPDDIYKIDQIIFYLRRCCRQLTTTVNERTIRELLIKNPTEFRLNSLLPIEQLLVKNGELADTFRKNNVLFYNSKKTNHIMEYRSASSQSIIDQLISTTGSDNEAEKLSSISALQWIQTHVYLDKLTNTVISKEIVQEIKQDSL